LNLEMKIFNFINISRIESDRYPDGAESVYDSQPTRIASFIFFSFVYFFWIS
jgi:hypothetical protein